MNSSRFIEEITAKIKLINLKVSSFSNENLLKNFCDKSNF